MANKQIKLFNVFMPESATDALSKTLFTGYVAEGPRVKEFTSLVSSYLQNPNTMMLCNCTMALHIACHLSDVQPGDEVISTPLTSICTNVPIAHLKGKPIWADVDPTTGISDINDVEKLINKKTKAIMLLHKDGDIVDLDKFVALAKAYNVKLIEDCAHTYGAQYNGRMIGNHGDFCCFSFQAIKHITTGDGGCMTVNDEELFERAKKLKWMGVDHDKRNGNPWLDDITELGYKANMNDIAATIGIEAQKHIDVIIEKYHHNGELYTKILSEMNIPGVQIIRRDPKAYSVYWTYVILSEKRDGLCSYLEENNVSAGQNHPRNDVWSIFKDSRRKLPGVDYFGSRELSLPSGWWVEDEDIIKICELIQKYHLTH